MEPHGRLAERARDADCSGGDTAADPGGAGVDAREQLDGRDQSGDCADFYRGRHWICGHCQLGDAFQPKWRLYSAEERATRRVWLQRRTARRGGRILRLYWFRCRVLRCAGNKKSAPQYSGWTARLACDLRGSVCARVLCIDRGGALQPAARAGPDCGRHRCHRHALVIAIGQAGGAGRAELGDSGADYGAIAHFLCDGPRWAIAGISRENSPAFPYALFDNIVDWRGGDSAGRHLTYRVGGRTGQYWHFIRLCSGMYRRSGAAHQAAGIAARLQNAGDLSGCANGRALGAVSDVWSARRYLDSARALDGAWTVDLFRIWPPP